MEEKQKQNHAKSFTFVDQLKSEDDLEKLHYEKITYDEEKTREIYNKVANIFGDILPVKITGEATGYGLGCKTWDDIVNFRGLDNLFYDLIERPDFMHKLAGKLTDIFLDKIRQYDELGLFDGDAYYIHSASALTNDLHPNQEHVRAFRVGKDSNGHCEKLLIKKPWFTRLFFMLTILQREMFHTSL